jgi:predicted aspartyl protease
VRWLPQLLALSAATVLAAPASARCQMEHLAQIPVETDRNQLLTQGELDGHAVRVLIDTGATLSLIWRPALARLGLRLTNGPRASLYGTGGETPVYGAFVKEFRVATFVSQNQRFPVAGDRPAAMDFILAEDLLSQASVEFDLQHHAVRTMEPTGCTLAELPYWATTYSMADLIASPHDAQAIQVDVLLNGRSVRALIDSGASISVVSKSLIDALGIHYVSASGGIVGFGRGALETWIADVQTFTLGDETIKNTQLRVAELSKFLRRTRLGSRLPVAVAGKADMLIGMDFLRAHRVLVDNSTRKMVFTYEGGPVFELRDPSESDTPSPEGVPPAQP